jgi:hypothetical protein
MYLHFLPIGVLAVCSALGLWNRISTLLMFLDFTYVFSWIRCCTLTTST